jgi:hypothetical protein
MATIYDSCETWDRLVLLLAARPREGWADIYEEITRREVERLAPHPREVESPAAGPSERGESDGIQDKEHSAYGCIIPD